MDNKWQPIDSAPTDCRVDVWAKRWISRTDTFEFKRFVDCYWRSTHFGNVPKEWHPTHWMGVPSDPAIESGPVQPGTEHARRWQQEA